VLASSRDRDHGGGGELAFALHRASREDGGNMDTHDFVIFQDVEAIGSNGLGLLCRVNGKEVWVPYANMARRECTVRRPGDCGLLVVPHWLAVNLELLDRAA
jgi:hypothetical protein